MAKWHPWVALVVGFVSIGGIVALSVIYPNPTGWQQYVFRGCYAIGAGALVSFITGYLTLKVTAKAWGSQASLLAGGAAVAFVLFYLKNPDPIQNIEPPMAAQAPAQSHLVKDIQGLWYSDYSYPITGGIVHIRGTTEYFSNGSCNFKGEMGISTTSDKGNADLLFDVDGSNEWSVTDQELTLKIVDIKSLLKKAVINGKVQEQIPPPFDSLLPKVADFVPKGTSSRFQILQADANDIRLMAVDPLSRQFQFDMVRTKNYFVRS